MLEPSHAENHGKTWTGRDLGAFLLLPSAQSISNSGSHTRPWPGKFEDRGVIASPGILFWCLTIFTRKILSYVQLAFPLAQLVTHCLLSFCSNWQHSGDAHTMTRELISQQVLRQNCSRTLWMEPNEGCCNPTLPPPSSAHPFIYSPSTHIRKQNPKKCPQFKKNKKTAISDSDINRWNHHNYFDAASFQTVISLNQLTTGLRYRLSAGGKAQKHKAKGRAESHNLNLYHLQVLWNHSLCVQHRQGGEKRPGTRDSKLNSPLLLYLRIRTIFPNKY